LTNTESNNQESEPFERKQFDEKDFIRKIAKAIHSLVMCARTKAEEQIDLEMRINQLELNQIESDCPADQSSALTYYKTYLLDLCKELTVQIFNMDRNAKTTLLIPLKTQKKLWPSSEEQFVQILLSQISQLGKSNSVAESKQYKPQNGQPFSLMTYYRKQRKLDFVDALLYDEMLRDEHDWSCHSEAVLQIKQQLMQNMNERDQNAAHSSQVS